MDEHRSLEVAALTIKDDDEFIRLVDGKDVPHWSDAWPRINELSRKGLVRVRPLHRYMANVSAVPPISAPR